MTEETRRLKIPYPSDGQDPYYPAFEAMLKSIDSISFADFSDRNMIFSGGGSVSWVGSKLSFTEAIVFTEATYGQRQSLSAVSDVYIPSGHFLHTEVSRGNTASVTLGVNVDSSIPINTQAVMLAWHNPVDGSLIWRSGSRQAEGQVITDVGNSSEASGSEFILTKLDPLLPNSRVLNAGDTDTIIIEDNGPQGAVSIDLKTVPNVAGVYTLASLTVSEQGQIVSVSEYSPSSLTERIIDVDVQPTLGFFKVYQNNIGIFPGGADGIGFKENVAVDADGGVHNFITQSWITKPHNGVEFIQASFTYPFKIPNDAVGLGDGTTLFRHFLKVSGDQLSTTVKYILSINGDIQQTSLALQDDDIVTDVPANHYPNLSIQGGSHATLEVMVFNSVSANVQFEMDFGPLELKFSTSQHHV
tara:strand:+ start:4019 stop:5263 length:1245 start_codon:yes stop_codon:yes gene_type:complete